LRLQIVHQYDSATMISVFAICVGACLGALARWGLGLWLNPGAALPLGTLTANLIGGYLVGIAVATFQALPHIDPAWRLAIITGFLGALTTFSSFSAEVVGMLGQQRYLLGFGTAAMHLFGSLLLTVAGIKTATLFIATRA
jgi:CrcB protein